MLLVGEELWKYLYSKGVSPHTHTNGLMSCYECSMVVATGKSVKELNDEWDTQMKKLSKDLNEKTDR